MKIIIREAEGEKPKIIYVPLWLVPSRLLAYFAAKKEEELSYSQVRDLLRTFKKSGKYLQGQPFVEIEENGGDGVTIYL